MKLKRMKLKQVKEFDRRGSATHEAGHVVVAAVLGVRGSAHIWETDTRQPYQEKTVIGTASFLLFPRPSKRTLGAVGIAGAIAELMADPKIDDYASQYLIEDWEELVGNTLSTTDLSLIPKGWKARQSAADKTQEILTDFARQHAAIREELIEIGDVSDGTVWDTVHGGPASLLP